MVSTAVGATSATISIWETSAAVVTQRAFGWSVLASSLYIAACFLSSYIGGELVNLVKKRVKESEMIYGSLLAIAVSSILIYWYLPPDPTTILLITGGEMPYTIGSVLVLNAANIARTYAQTLANRAASGYGSKVRRRTSVTVSTVQAIGRAAGALVGLGVMESGEGANYVAAFIGGSALLALVALLPSKELRQALHEA
mmetsp:Transcript_46516/g.155244  ORF Transcript_46516/g.155244 Transcript_46516/m.155244 type:complete len:199 (+) Transcript_46516:94-690(+)